MNTQTYFVHVNNLGGIAHSPAGMIRVLRRLAKQVDKIDIAWVHIVYANDDITGVTNLNTLDLLHYLLTR